MQRFFRKRGATSVILRFLILDLSEAATNTGVGKTGLAFNTASLLIATIANNEATPVVYDVTGSTIEDITTLGTYAAPTATKCRFKEVDATNLPGVYELQLADARFAVAGSKELIICVTGAADIQQTTLAVHLSADANAAEISDDAAAADNLEKDYDGTGYDQDTEPKWR